MLFATCYVTVHQILGKVTFHSSLRNIKGARADHPNVPKKAPAGKKTGLAEQRVLLELRKTRKVSDLWKQGQENQQEYKDAMWLCREKIRRAKALLELNLSTTSKDNKNINTLTTKGELRSISVLIECRGKHSDKGCGKG